MDEDDLRKLLGHIKGIAQIIEKHINVEKPVKVKRSNVPYQQIADLWNRKMPELRQIVELNDTRRRHIKQRWLDQLPDLDAWSDYFDYIRESKFLMGGVSQRDRKPFVADFDWIIKPANYVKILEGKYHGKV